MRVIYYSQTFFTDCDFPLIRELQCKGIDVRYFFPIYEWNKRQALLDLKSIKPKKGIYKASEYSELSIYKEYINLDKIYLINVPNGGDSWKIKAFWIYVFIRMLMMFPNVFHFTWQLRDYEKYLYHLPGKKFMTVHDPLSHSSVKDGREELDRKQAFRNSNKFMLLSDVLKDEFSEKYGISLEHINYTHMGEFDHLRLVKAEDSNIGNPYILYFGQILSYKGIEYLCEAMKKIHDKHPNVNLIVAGRGEIYFDYTPYEKLDYIMLQNRYLSITDIATLLHGALFAVCPYKDATQSGVVQTAFSARCPMIVTNVGALPDAVKDGIYGKVVPPCDSTSLANAMDELLSNPKLLKEYKENIEKLWCPSMEWTSIANDYINVWSK